MLVPDFVVVWEYDHIGADEPVSVVGVPSSCAAGVAGRDQSFCFEAVGVFFSFNDVDHFPLLNSLQHSRQPVGQTSAAVHVPNPSLLVVKTTLLEGLGLVPHNDIVNLSVRSLIDVLANSFVERVTHLTLVPPLLDVPSGGRILRSSFRVPASGCDRGGNVSASAA